MSFEFLIPIAFFFAAVALVKIISDNRLRRHMIEKGNLDENIKYLYQQNQAPQPLSSIKWGLVLIGIGLALFLNQLFPYTISDEGTVGLMFLLAGIGFLVYYFIARKHINDAIENAGNSLEK